MNMSNTFPALAIPDAFPANWAVLERDGDWIIQDLETTEEVMTLGKGLAFLRSLRVPELKSFIEELSEAILEDREEANRRKAAVEALPPSGIQQKEMSDEA